jgi:hypothetical protein
MEFTQDDLFDAIDKAIRRLLNAAGQQQPPVDALALAEQQYGLVIEFAEPEEPKRYGDRPKRRPSPNTIVLREDQSEQTHHLLAARAIAKQLTPGILEKLGVPPDAGGKAGLNQLIGLIVPRLLLPTAWFGSHARKAGFHLLELWEKYPTATVDLIAWRMLEVDEDCSVIAIVDDGNVTARRSNRFAATKQLTEAEAACVAAVAECGEPSRHRRENWTAWGWPSPGLPFGRIILRAVPDEL